MFTLGDGRGVRAVTTAAHLAARACKHRWISCIRAAHLQALLADCQADGSLQGSLHARCIPAGCCRRAGSAGLQLLDDGVHQPRALQQLHMLCVALQAVARQILRSAVCTCAHIVLARTAVRRFQTITQNERTSNAAAAPSPVACIAAT